jgi:hypothetical protein
MDSVVIPQKRTPEGSQGCDPEQEPEHQGEEQEQPRKRARLSCNSCKARKTKASRLITTMHATCVKVDLLLQLINRLYIVCRHW